MKISLQFETISLEATLNHTETGKTIYNALPIEARVSVWGKELYFEIPEYINLEDGAIAQVNEGDLAYWPSGRCFCIFWGPTPLSSGSKPVAASAVNVFGNIAINITSLDSIKDGESIVIEKL